MPLILFLVCTVTGSLLWSAVIVAPELMLGGHWDRMYGVFQLFSLLVLLIIAALIAIHFKCR
jgi:membrane protein DedA with SNARE-associated domain